MLAADEGSIYNTAAYLEILCEATGGRFRVLALDRGGELAGGIALYQEATRTGPAVAPRLLLQYNGIVLAPHESKYPSEKTARQIELTSALCLALASSEYARLSVKCRHPLKDVRAFAEAGWAIRPSYTYEVGIADLDGAWGRVEQNLRRLVQRCAREGVVFREDGDFESYYRLHEDTHRRKGARLYLPHDRFLRYFERLRERDFCRMFDARLPDGRVLASQLVLTAPHPVAHTASAAADAQHLNLGANAFLRWKVFEWLSQHGYRANDLTDAPLNEVTHFKAQLGGDLKLCLAMDRPVGWHKRLTERMLRFAGRSRRILRRPRRGGGAE